MRSKNVAMVACPPVGDFVPFLLRGPRTLSVAINRPSRYGKPISRVDILVLQGLAPPCLFSLCDLCGFA